MNSRQSETVCNYRRVKIIRGENNPQIIQYMQIYTLWVRTMQHVIFRIKNFFWTCKANKTYICKPSLQWPVVWNWLWRLHFHLAPLTPWKPSFSVHRRIWIHYSSCSLYSAIKKIKMLWIINKCVSEDMVIHVISRPSRNRGTCTYSCYIN